MIHSRQKSYSLASPWWTQLPGPYRHGNQVGKARVCQTLTVGTLPLFHSVVYRATPESFRPDCPPGTAREYEGQPRKAAPPMASPSGARDREETAPCVPVFLPFPRKLGTQTWMEQEVEDTSRSQEGRGRRWALPVTTLRRQKNTNQFAQI